MKTTEFGTKQLKKVVVVSLVLILSISMIVIVLNIIPPERALSSEAMGKYARVFAETYSNEIDFFFPRHRKHFPFYSSLSYTARAIISRTHGVAILFEPSDVWHYEYQTTDKRVEDAIFGGNWSTWPMVIVPPGTVHSIIINGTWESNGHPFIEVQGKGSIILQYMTINSVYYQCVIIKGSNETIFWASNAAKEDAKDVFDVDLGTAISESEEVRKRYAEPELTSLLKVVIEKLHKPQIEYGYLEMEEDIRYIERLAFFKYNIADPSDFVKNILAYLERKNAPQKTVFGFPIEDPSNWMYVTAWCAFPLTTFALYLAAVYLVKEYPKKLRDLKGWGRFIFGIVVSGGFASLLHNKPYDYEFLSVQTLIIIIVLVIGIIVMLKSRHYLCPH